MLFRCTCAAVLQLGCTLAVLMTWISLLQLESLPNLFSLLQVNPQSSVLQCYAGMALHKMGRIQEALQQLQVGMPSWRWLALGTCLGASQHCPVCSALGNSARLRS